jgi:aryl-phospho-beta-D-glucosidase BglC (GH1 family)
MVDGSEAAIDMPKLIEAGFNGIRISYYNATFDRDLARIDLVVAAAKQYGVKVIIDHHADETPSPTNHYLPQQPNGLPIDSGPGTDGTDGAGDHGTVTLAKFIADWVKVAQHYAGDSTVIGFDLDNEPLHYPGMSTWGDGRPTDLRAMYIQAGNAIQTVNPGALIIAEGPQNYQRNFLGTAPAPYGDLSLVATKPVTLNIPNKVVYSVHDYPAAIGGFSLDSEAAVIAAMNADFGYLVTQNIAPVWIGEMGGSLDGSSESAGKNLAEERRWGQTLVDYMNGKYAAQGGPKRSGNEAMSGSWWAWGNLDGQSPDGTLDNRGNLRPGQRAIYRQIQMTRAACETDGTPHPPQH